MRFKPQNSYNTYNPCPNFLYPAIDTPVECIGFIESIHFVFPVGGYLTLPSESLPTPQQKWRFKTQLHLVWSKPLSWQNLITSASHPFCLIPHPKDSKPPDIGHPSNRTSQKGPSVSHVDQASTHVVEHLSQAFISQGCEPLAWVIPNGPITAHWDSGEPTK